MNSELLQKLRQLIVDEVVRRVARLERQKQHPEQVLVLLTAPVAYPKELMKLLHSQFGAGYTLVSFPEKSEVEEDGLLFSSQLGEP